MKATAAVRRDQPRDWHLAQALLAEMNIRQHEMLNWMALAGRWSARLQAAGDPDYMETYILASDKCFCPSRLTH